MAQDIIVHREVLPALADLELEWRELERYAQSSSFFLSWHWIGTLLHMLPEASRPSLLRVCINRLTCKALRLLVAFDFKSTNGESDVHLSV